jgi:uncharacterized protein YoxC
MNKYEIKYQLEQMTSSVDRLTDVAGKQVNHIEELWKEIELKQDRIKELQETIQDKDFELEDLNQHYTDQLRHLAEIERENKKLNEDRLKFKTAEATIEKKLNKQFNLESVDN